MGTILRVTSILTPFNTEKYLCQCSVTLVQRLSNGQNYAIVCPNLTYLWDHS